LPRDLGGSFCPRRLPVGTAYRFRIAVDPLHPVQSGQPRRRRVAL